MTDTGMPSLIALAATMFPSTRSYALVTSCCTSQKCVSEASSSSAASMSLSAMAPHSAFDTCLPATVLIAQQSNLATQSCSLLTSGQHAVSCPEKRNRSQPPIRFVDECDNQLSLSCLGTCPYLSQIVHCLAISPNSSLLTKPRCLGCSPHGQEVLALKDSSALLMSSICMSRTSVSSGHTS